MFHTYYVKKGVLTGVASCYSRIPKEGPGFRRFGRICHLGKKYENGEGGWGSQNLYQ